MLAMMLSNYLGLKGAGQAIYMYVAPYLLMNFSRCCFFSSNPFALNVSANQSQSFSGQRSSEKFPTLSLVSIFLEAAIRARLHCEDAIGSKCVHNVWQFSCSNSKADAMTTGGHNISSIYYAQNVLAC